MIIIRGQTAITDQNRAGDFLVQHGPHFALHKRNNVQVDDVDHVIAVQLLLLVHCGGRSGTLEQGEDLFLLHVALHIALCASFIHSDVGEERLDPAESAVMGTAHNRVDPFGIPLNELGHIIQCLVVREQVIHVGDAITDLLVVMVQQVSALLVALMNQDIAVVHAHVGHNGFFQTAATLGVCEDRLIIVGSQVIISLGIALKHIVLHFGILLIIVVTGFAALTFERLADHEIHDILLLFRHGIEDVLHGLFLVFSHGFLILSFVGFIRLSAGILMGQSFFLSVFHALLKLIAHTEHSLFLVLNHVIAMSHGDKLDRSAGISGSQHKADLADVTVQHITAGLLQLVGIDAHRANITVSQQHLAVFGERRIIESAIGINAFRLVDQQRMAQHIGRVVMLVLPYQRNGLAIVVFKGIPSNRAAVSAPNIVFRCPTAEIVFLHTFHSF